MKKYSINQLKILFNKKVNELNYKIKNDTLETYRSEDL